MLQGWDELEIVNGRENIDKKCYVEENIYHCTNSIDIYTLSDKDTIFLKSNNGFFGKGLYFSSRPEYLYGNTVLVLNDEHCTQIADNGSSNWYLVEDGLFNIDNIKDNKVYISRIKEGVLI